MSGLGRWKVECQNLLVCDLLGYKIFVFSPRYLISKPPIVCNPVSSMLYPDNLLRRVQKKSMVGGNEPVMMLCVFRNAVADAEGKNLKYG